MALICTLVLFMSVFYTPTEEKPLMVVQKQRQCSTPAPKQCAKAAVVRGGTQIGLPAMCYHRVDPGPCGRDLIRVYYDWKTNRCKHFSYSGCGGNANRFISIKNCYHICNPGYRTRFVGTRPPPVPVVDKCSPPSVKEKIKLNMT